MSAEQTEVATTVSTELSLPERAIAAMKLQVTAAQLTELASKTADIKAITNADGRKQAHAAAMVLADQRIAIDKAGKSARDDANKFAKAVIAEKDKLIGLIEPEEKRLLGLRDEWDAKIEAERQAKIAAESKRVAAIVARIDEIKALPAGVVNRSAAVIEETIVNLVGLSIDATFQEFQTAAEEARQYMLTKLRQMLADRQAHEADQERLRRERDELAKQRAEQEEANRRERERIAAEEAEARRKREAEEAAAAAEHKRKLDEELAKLRAQREENERIAKAERDRAAAERQRQQDEAESRQRAEQQRLDEERERAQAEHARIAAENARQAEELRRQQAEIERQREEQAASARAEQQRIDSQRAELERQQQEIAAAQAHVNPAPVEGPATEAEVVVAEAAPVAAEEFRPSRIHMVALVAHDFGVSQATAERWLVEEFSSKVPA